jgi:hypothetical protein
LQSSISKAVQASLGATTQEVLGTVMHASVSTSLQVVIGMSRQASVFTFSHFSSVLSCGNSRNTVVSGPEV